MSSSTTTFEPHDVCEYFSGITQRPHASANQIGVSDNEDPLRRYVVEQARKIPGVNVVYYKPDAPEAGERVIILCRPGNGNYEKKKPIILQAHLDMVYNPINLKFPLTIIPDPSHTDGIWIKALDNNNTPSTLGADDGIGVATALALLKDNRLKDYPIECLFTVQEETDMGGAQKCPLDSLNGDTLLNLDAAALKVIIYGSAGGAETNYNKTITRFKCPDDYAAIKLSISGLRGGHSGVDINKGRQNAIKLLSRILTRLNKRIYNLDVDGSIRSYDFYLCNFKRTDIIKANAIPTSAEAIVAIPKTQEEKFTSDFNDYCKFLKCQFQPIENRFSSTATQSDVDLQPLDKTSTDAIFCLISQLSTGVISMIPQVPDVVETSSNLYAINLSSDSVMIALSNRSSNDGALGALKAAQSNIGKIFNFDVTTGINDYVSWQPNENSHLLKVSREVYRRYYQEDAHTTVVHAGLECGTLANRFKSEKKAVLDCVSIGPTIKNPHTCNETLQIESEEKIQTVKQFYECVAEIVTVLFEKP